MIRSLISYIFNFIYTFCFRHERIFLIKEIIRFYPKVYKISIFSKWNDAFYSKEERKKASENAINWILRAQKMFKDDGIGSYHIVKRWSSSYPETTGYIIPTLIGYGKIYNNEETINSAIRAADWLLQIQKPSGGWQGERLEDSRPEVVFNTGQVVRGMIAAFEFTEKKKYLTSIVSACDWLCDVQEKEGYWKRFAFRNVARVYDSYVDAPLLEAYKITGNEKYKIAAIKNLDWILSKQKENGWFEDCDNTIKRNDKPILHTISYTIDGLFDCGVFLNDEKYISAAKKAADILLEKFKKDKFLNGRFDKNWKGYQHQINTGCAQISIVWLKLYKHFGNKEYLLASRKMNDLLIFVQNRKAFERPNTKGGLPGSFPIWGRYEPFTLPNWATKYFIDSLLLETTIEI